MKLKVGDQILSLKYNYNNSIETGDLLTVTDVNIKTGKICFYNETKQTNIQGDIGYVETYFKKDIDFELRTCLKRKLNILLNEDNIS